MNVIKYRKCGFDFVIGGGREVKLSKVHFTLHLSYSNNAVVLYWRE